MIGFSVRRAAASGNGVAVSAGREGKTMRRQSGAQRSNGKAKNGHVKRRQGEAVNCGGTVGHINAAAWQATERQCEGKALFSMARRSNGDAGCWIATAKHGNAQRRQSTAGIRTAMARWSIPLFCNGMAWRNNARLKCSGELVCRATAWRSIAKSSMSTAKQSGAMQGRVSHRKGKALLCNATAMQSACWRCDGMATIRIARRRKVRKATALVGREGLTAEWQAVETPFRGWQDKAKPTNGKAN